MASSNQDGDFEPHLINAYIELSAADKSVLIEGIKNPGATLLTNKGSANDRFWADLSKIGLMAKADLPEPIASSPAAGELSAWCVTDDGSVSLPRLVERASE